MINLTSLLIPLSVICHSFYMEKDYVITF